MESSFMGDGAPWSYSQPIVQQPGMAVPGKPYFRQFPPKKQPSQPQILYCEICRISCAGPQPYSDHLAGQKHKKKEATLALQQKIDGTNKTSKSAVAANASRLYCQLCDVACGSADTFTAHVRGIKHQRVLSLHTLIGKPIPSEAATEGSPSVDGLKAAEPVSEAVIGLDSSQSLKKEDVKAEVKAEDTVDVVDADAATQSSEFVGLEFIEEVKNERGVIVSYTCRLCQCSFTDPNAKRVHLKGRRHRLQYKKKVDPTLQVEAKPNSRTQRIREERLEKQQAKESYWRQQDILLGMRLEQSQAVDDFEMWSKPRKALGARQNTADDHYMLTKHLSLYPSKEQMADIHNSIVSFENALKIVSDIIATEDTPIEIGDSANSTEPAELNAVKIEIKQESDSAETSPKKTSKDEEPNQDVEDAEGCRVLKGAMRVGPLSKGLLIHGDVVEHLVIICSERPTRTLLQRILDHLPTQIESVSQKKFSIEPRFDESGFIVKVDVPSASFMVTLTSSPDKESAAVESAELLSKEHCSSALAQLRRTKWFQVRLSVLKAGTVVTHVLRDFCRKNAVWSPLSEWAQELLVEKCVFAAGLDIGPGEALRTFFECISSGILLPGGHGLMDPCEKTSADVTAELTAQQREDITASAQRFLRMLACRQIYKILGLEPYRRTRFKRRKSQGVDQLETEQKKPREENAAEKDLNDTVEKP